MSGKSHILQKHRHASQTLINISRIFDTYGILPHKY